MRISDSERETAGKRDVGRRFSMLLPLSSRTEREVEGTDMCQFDMTVQTAPYVHELSTLS